MKKRVAIWLNNWSGKISRLTLAARERRAAFLGALIVIGTYTANEILHDRSRETLARIDKAQTLLISARYHRAEMDRLDALEEQIRLGGGAQNPNPKEKNSKTENKTTDTENGKREKKIDKTLGELRDY